MATRIFLRLEFALPAGFGPHRAAVLEAVEAYGSIAIAAAALGITYRRTWQSIREINDQFGEMVVVRRGRHGGGASLTPEASEVLRRYREIERRIYEVFADEFKAIEALVGEDPKSPIRVPNAQRVDAARAMLEVEKHEGRTKSKRVSVKRPRGQGPQSRAQRPSTKRT